MRVLIPVLMIASGLAILPSLSSATPEYARQTGFECARCHIDGAGGGVLTDAGIRYRDELKTRGVYRPLSPVQKGVRLAIGYLHLMTGILWFGTILYVHILLKPAYAAKGLPRGELLLGWVSIIIMLVTGTLLSIARVPSWKMLYTTRFGVLLSIKIFLFLMMVGSAVIVTFLIRPKMKKQRAAGKVCSGDGCSMEDVAYFDGTQGRPAYIVHKGLIYDVSGSKLWRGGVHLMKHTAGNDLTDALRTAPHGEEKILAMPVMGRLRPEGSRPRRPFHERVFYSIAYMNLVLTFLIIFVVALWRWW